MNRDNLAFFIAFPLFFVLLMLGAAGMSNMVKNDVQENTQIVQTAVFSKYERASEGFFGATTEYLIELQLDGETKKVFPIAKEMYDQLQKGDVVTVEMVYDKIEHVTVER